MHSESRPQGALRSSPPAETPVPPRFPGGASFHDPSPFVHGWGWDRRIPCTPMTSKEMKTIASARGGGEDHLGPRVHGEGEEQCSSSVDFFPRVLTQARNDTIHQKHCLLLQ